MKIRGFQLWLRLVRVRAIGCEASFLALSVPIQNMSTLRLEFLGGLSAVLDVIPVTGFISNKVRALLVYLAVTARPHSRDHLAALLWGDMSDVDAKSNLRQALANLRKLLEPYLDIARETVEFRRDASYTLDVEEFEKQIADSRLQIADSDTPSAGIARDSISHLPSAISQYHGDFLAGVYVRDAPEFEEWALAQRARLRDLAVDALESLIKQFTARGAYAQAIEYGKQLLMLDPWREEVHCEVMQLYARSGQRSAALAQYETCRSVLREQLGVEPSEETNAWYERIRAAGTNLPPALPLQPTVFVGRAAELAQLDTLLLNAQVRLITILGVGGAGKTRLALEAAHRAHKMGAFLNGVAFVSLVDLDDIALLAPAMAHAFGLRLSGTTKPDAQIADYLRAKEMLVVLDNFESLRDAAPWVGQLLQTAPRVKFLVTAREKLNLRSEWVMALEGIAYPRAHERANALAFDAVRMFAERAQQTYPAFALDETTASCVARVCELVEGLPLGIELAAAWTSQFTCEELAREIERSYDFLATNLRDVPARQASLRAVFEYAWARSNGDERDVYARAALFQNGFTLDAAQRVARASARTLAGLHDKALLRRDANGRYDIHPVLKQYAREKLGLQNDADAAQDAHSAYYLELLRAQQGNLLARAQRASIELLSVENENLRAAWTNAVARGEWARLDGALDAWSLFYDMTSQFLAARALLEETLAALEAEAAADARLLCARIQAQLAYFCGRLSGSANARAFAETALTELGALATDTRRERAFCLATLANAALDVGEQERAEALCRESLALRREIDDRRGILGSLLSLTSILWHRGDFEAARALAQEGAALARAVGDDWNSARFLSGLGVLNNSQGRLDDAGQVFPESLALYQALGDSEGAAQVMFNLGVTHYHRKEFDRARELFQSSLDLRQGLGDRFGVASCVLNLGEIARVQNDVLAAARYFEHALELSHAIQHKYGEAYALKGLGDVLVQRNPGEAAMYYRQALQLANEMQVIPFVLEILLGMARLAAQQGDTARAAQILAVVAQHPAVMFDTRRDAEQLLAQLPPASAAAPKTYAEIVQELLNLRQ
ncbi:MAG: tetratricopeptide repeat protein [Chloroflexi bacterium]|nr:tetratricopeptide repeat protein [Chloroflexota bacterium]